MLSRSVRVLLVQSVTSLRVAGAIAFASVALSPRYSAVALLIYVSALFSDLADGFLARRLRVATQFGAAYDGFADKAMTVVSALYLVALDAPVVPCCIVLFRDLLVLSIRAIPQTTFALLPPSRTVGALSGAAIRIVTVYVLVSTFPNPAAVSAGAWAAAAISVALFARDAWRSRAHILKALTLIKCLKRTE